MFRMPHALIVAGLILAGATPSLAQDRSADLTFSGGSVAAGVGYTWGDGTLHFKGSDYRFALNGLSVVDVGIAHIEAAGDVYNLRRIEDFSGNYVAADAGATVAGGGALTVLENQNGVRIFLRSTTQGAKLSLATEGVAVALR
jgi:hypothetical protein